MNPPHQRMLRSYAGFVGVVTVTAAVIAGGGLFVVSRMTEGGVPAWLAGCGASWAASCLGAIVPARVAASGGNVQPIHAVLGATVVRFLSVMVLAVVLVLGGWFHRTVLVIAVGVSYLLMLVVDSIYSVQVMRRRLHP